MRWSNVLTYEFFRIRGFNFVKQDLLDEGRIGALKFKNKQDL